jgi:hypothetical protein
MAGDPQLFKVGTSLIWWSEGFERVADMRKKKRISRLYRLWIKIAILGLIILLLPVSFLWNSLGPVGRIASVIAPAVALLITFMYANFVRSKKQFARTKHWGAGRVHAIVFLTEYDREAVARSVSFARACRPERLDALTISGSWVPDLLKRWHDVEDLPPLKVLENYFGVTHALLNFGGYQANPRNIVWIFLPIGFSPGWRGGLRRLIGLFSFRGLLLLHKRVRVMSVPAQIRSSPDVAETTLPQARIRK